MRKLILLTLLLCLTTVALADLTPGDPLPNCALVGPDGKSKVELHDLLDDVTVIHMWKCN